MAKKVMGVVKLHCPAGKANPAPPVGPALGQYGINIMEFCKAFNEKTKQDMGDVVRVEITIYQDQSFSFVTKSPPTASLLKKAAGIDSASGEPNRQKVGHVTTDQITEIAKRKMEDLNARDLDAAANIIAGTARSMGLIVAETAEEGAARLEQIQAEVEEEEQEQAEAELEAEAQLEADTEQQQAPAVQSPEPTAQA